MLGVGGGIAAYKAPELVRHLTRAGAQVRVVLTGGAQEFVSPLALQVVSGHRVGTDLLDASAEFEIGHIELARWADAVVIAPATANLLARMAGGHADDLLTTVVLATTAPVVVFPSMNTQMLLHPATQQNIATLAVRARTTVVDPDSGDLACREVGAGRLPDPDVILAELERAVSPRPLQGLRLSITAGPTREHFDPVRFLSNPSSGRMGYALAHAARVAGADVTLVTGPTALDLPHGVRVVRVETAAEMHAAAIATLGDIYVSAAAVADYTPAEVAPQKRKKTAEDWVPVLTRTVDILATVSASPQRPSLVVGFAAETEAVEANALSKLFNKRLDGIVANSVAGAEGAFGSVNNQVTLLEPEVTGRVVGPAPKEWIAHEIVAWIAELWARRVRR